MNEKMLETFTVSEVAVAMVDYLMEVTYGAAHPNMASPAAMRVQVDVSLIQAKLRKAAATRWSKERTDAVAVETRAKGEAPRPLHALVMELTERVDAHAVDIAGMNSRMEDLLEEGGKVSSRLLELSVRRVEDLEAKAKELSARVAGISSAMDKWREDHLNALVFQANRVDELDAASKGHADTTAQLANAVGRLSADATFQAKRTIELEDRVKNMRANSVFQATGQVPPWVVGVDPAKSGDESHVTYAGKRDGGVSLDEHIARLNALPEIQYTRAQVQLALVNAGISPATRESLLSAMNDLRLEERRNKGST